TRIVLPTSIHELARAIRQLAPRDRGKGVENHPTLGGAGMLGAGNLSLHERRPLRGRPPSRCPGRPPPAPPCPRAGGPTLGGGGRARRSAVPKAPADSSSRRGVPLARRVRSPRHRPSPSALREGARLSERVQPCALLAKTLRPILGEALHPREDRVRVQVRL